MEHMPEAPLRDGSTTVNPDYTNDWDDRVEPPHANLGSTPPSPPSGRHHCPHNPAPLTIPVRTFTKQGRTITIYGLMHVAPPEFWERMAERLIGHADQGAALHFEGTNLKDAPRRWKIPARIARQAQQLPGTMITRWVPDLQAQKDGLQQVKQHPASRRVDIPQHELLSGFRLTGWARIGMGALAARTLPNAAEHRQKAFTRRILNEGVHALREQTTDAIPKRVTDPALMRARNTYAIRAAEAETGDVVLIWGVAHLHGMTDLLVQHGWTNESTEQLPWGTLCTQCGIAHD